MTFLFCHKKDALGRPWQCRNVYHLASIEIDLIRLEIDIEGWFFSPLIEFLLSVIQMSMEFRLMSKPKAKGSICGTKSLKQFTSVVARQASNISQLKVEDDCNVTILKLVNNSLLKVLLISLIRYNDFMRDEVKLRTVMYSCYYFFFPLLNT